MVPITRGPYILNMIKTVIEQDIKQAMRDKNRDILRTLRSLKNAFIVFEKNKGTELDEVTSLNIIKKQIKQRYDSIKSYEQAKRQDLIDIEITEINILEAYVPKQMEESEIKERVYKIIEEYKKEVEVLTGRDIGKILQVFNVDFAGKADNSLVVKCIKSQI